MPNNRSQKRRRSSPEPFSRKRKARTRTPTPPPHVDPIPQETPHKRRMSSHCSLTSKEIDLDAAWMELQIAAEARGVTRKNVPYDTFRSIYLSSCSVEAPSLLDIQSLKNIGGNWKKGPFFNQFSQLLSNAVLGDLKLYYGGTKTLINVNKSKEVPSKPDCVLHISEDVSDQPPNWEDVELLLEHTESSSSQDIVTKKFKQWLRGAWSVFYHQPFRLRLYGIMFIRPCAFICYADHGCAVYSEPLHFVESNQDAQFLQGFLSWFFANPDRRGRDPTVNEVDGMHIRHAGETWTERPNILCYRPCVVGRNIRVTKVRSQSSTSKMVMKNSWEEKLPPESSPSSEIEVLKLLLAANVRGLPQPHALDEAILRETPTFPENCDVALMASNEKHMEKIQGAYASRRSSKFWALVDDPLSQRVKTARQEFNKPLDVRRQLTRVLMSYCAPLKEAMCDAGPISLTRSIRDAMIVYYEAYKLPKSGFIHGDISIENILVPVEGCELTGGLTYEDRRGTLIDWNLCFNADGTASYRSFRSGTPAFMAPALLGKKEVPRRTLGHDMESFFAVMIWIASFDYDNEEAFLTKPLAMTTDRRKSPTDIAAFKKLWFHNVDDFLDEIAYHFELPYRSNRRFLECLLNMREILYPRRNDFTTYWNTLFAKPVNGVAEDADPDPMKEGLFRACMKEMDNYLDETKGCDEMRRIDSSSAQQRHTLGEDTV